jgi:hypothetical protein
LEKEILTRGRAELEWLVADCEGYQSSRYYIDVGWCCPDGNTLFAGKAESDWAMIAAQEQSFDCKGINKGTTGPRKLS